MSDNDEKVGRGKPPKHTRFKPGQSGNPKGRPREVPRAEVPSQILEDVRKVAKMEVVIKTANGPKTVPGSVAVLFAIMKGALDGRPTALRLFLDLLMKAYRDNVRLDPILHLVDGDARILRGVDKDEMEALWAALAERSRKPRRGR